MPSGIASPIAPASAPQRRRHAVVVALALLDDVLVVAREQLVAAVAGEHDLDVLGGELRHHVGRNRRRVAERLVEIPGEVLDDRNHVRLEHELVVLRAERLRDFARVRELVEAVLGEADRERLDRRPGCLAAIVATTALESMPPLRNAPTGTSLT